MGIPETGSEEEAEEGMEAAVEVTFRGCRTESGGGASGCRMDLGMVVVADMAGRGEEDDLGEK